MTITLQRRLLYIPVLHIDTNLINARQKLPGVNRLEHWYAEGVIHSCALVNRHRGRGYPRTPATPPDMRVRIRRFGGLSCPGSTNRGKPSESK
jgi:hypothetical protein